MIGSGFWASGRLFGAIWQAGKLNQRRSRGVAGPNTRPCQGRERRFESGRDRHAKFSPAAGESRAAEQSAERWPSPVDGGGLENRYSRKAIGGSNPSLSASEAGGDRPAAGSP